MEDARARPRILSSGHPLVFAARGLLADLLSTLAFLAIFEITGRLSVAVGWAVALGIAQIALRLFRRQPIAAMQWLSLFLVVVFGGASLLSGSFMLYRLKFTLIYLALGGVTLLPGWMNHYVTPAARAHAADLNLIFGYVWSALFLVTALGNLGLALLAKPYVWGWFIAVFPTASKIVLIGVQYSVTRRIVRRRRRAEPQPRASISTVQPRS